MMTEVQLESVEKDLDWANASDKKLAEIDVKTLKQAHADHAVQPQPLALSRDFEPAGDLLPGTCFK